MTEIGIWAGLAVGVLFGAASCLSDFCLLRSLRGQVYHTDGAPLRSFVLAMAVALAGTQLLASQVDVDLSQSIYVQTGIALPAAIFGGLLFGLGMVMANSCGARALVLSASGNLRSWVVLACVGLAGYATMKGVLSPLRQWLTSWGILTLEPSHASLSSWLHELTGLSELGLWLVSGLLPGLLLALWAFTNAGLRASPRLWIGAVGVGLAIVAGWAVSGYWAVDEFNPMPPVSLSYVAPIGQALLYSMISTGMEMDFAVATVLGTVLGGGLLAVCRRQLRWQGFANARQMLRYMAGGVLMGVGGVLATGCSIGQLLSGFSTLAIQSFVAIAAILLGARLGMILFAPPHNPH